MECLYLALAKGQAVDAHIVNKAVPALARHVLIPGNAQYVLREVRYPRNPARGLRQSRPNATMPVPPC
jgi:hypothetical protein